MRLKKIHKKFRRFAPKLHKLCKKSALKNTVSAIRTASGSTFNCTTDGHEIRTFLRSTLNCATDGHEIWTFSDSTLNSATDGHEIRTFSGSALNYATDTKRYGGSGISRFSKLTNATDGQTLRTAVCSTQSTLRTLNATAVPGFCDSQNQPTLRTVMR